MKPSKILPPLVIVRSILKINNKFSKSKNMTKITECLLIGILKSNLLTENNIKSRILKIIMD